MFISILLFVLGIMLMIYALNNIFNILGVHPKINIDIFVISEYSFAWPVIWLRTVMNMFAGIYDLSGISILFLTTTGFVVFIYYFVTEIRPSKLLFNPGLLLMIIAFFAMLLFMPASAKYFYGLYNIVFLAYPAAIIWSVIILFVTGLWRSEFSWGKILSIITIGVIIVSLFAGFGNLLTTPTLGVIPSPQYTFLEINKAYTFINDSGTYLHLKVYVEGRPVLLTNIVVGLYGWEYDFLKSCVEKMKAFIKNTYDIKFCLDQAERELNDPGKVINLNITIDPGIHELDIPLESLKQRTSISYTMYNGKVVEPGTGELLPLSNWGDVEYLDQPIIKSFDVSITLEYEYKPVPNSPGAILSIYSAKGKVTKYIHNYMLRIPDEELNELKNALIKELDNIQRIKDLEDYLSRVLDILWKALIEGNISLSYGWVMEPEKVAEYAKEGKIRVYVRAIIHAYEVIARVHDKQLNATYNVTRNFYAQIEARYPAENLTLKEKSEYTNLVISESSPVSYSECILLFYKIPEENKYPAYWQTKFDIAEVPLLNYKSIPQRK